MGTSRFSRFGLVRVACRCRGRVERSRRGGIHVHSDMCRETYV